MGTLKTLDDYDSIGNSLEDINQNFSLMNFRFCNYTKAQESMRSFISTFAELSSKYENTYTLTNQTSGAWHDTTNIVNNLNGYWLSPVSFIYPSTFSYIGNYADVLSWMNNTFGNEFFVGQIAQVTFFVKSYDDSILSNTPIANVLPSVLDAVSSANGTTTRIIKDYIIYKNHVDTLVAAFNNAVKRENRLDLAINDYTGLPTLESFNIILRNISKIGYETFKQTSIDLIYSIVYQYEILKNNYLELIATGVNNISPTIIAQFNGQNVYNTYNGVFDFIYTSAGWKYIPDANVNFCVNNDDCTDYQDPNTFYIPGACRLAFPYELTGCDGTLFTSKDTQLEQYFGQYLDIFVDGIFYKVQVNAATSKHSYANSNVLFGDRLEIIGLSIDQSSCFGPPPVVETSTTMSPVPPIFSIYEGFTDCIMTTPVYLYVNYGNSIDVGTTVYTDETLTTLFPDSTFVYGFLVYYVIGGIINSTSSCSPTTTIMPTTTTTTTLIFITTTPSFTTTVSPTTTTTTTTSTTTTTTTIAPTTSPPFTTPPPTTTSTTTEIIILLPTTTAYPG